jgi:hypothetical protein
VEVERGAQPGRRNVALQGQFRHHALGMDAAVGAAGSGGPRQGAAIELRPAASITSWTEMPLDWRCQPTKSRPS